MRTATLIGLSLLLITLSATMGHAAPKPSLPPNLIDAPNIEIGLKNEYFGSGVFHVPIKKSGGDLHAALFRLRFALNERWIVFDSVSISQQLRQEEWEFRFTASRNVKYGTLASPITIITINASRVSREAVPIANGELFQLWMHISDQRGFEEKAERIIFAWTDCDDNAFRVSSLDTAYVAAMVSAFGEVHMLTDYVMSYENSCDVPRRVRTDGPCHNCLVSGKMVTRVPRIIFTGGGVSGIYQGDSDYPGDVNQNGIAYEVADAELLQKFLANSIYEIDTSSQRFDPIMKATDANEDGQVASIADVVYLYRVIVGDALPFPRLKPYQNIVDVTVRGDTVGLESDSAIAGVLLKFRSRETPEITSLSPLQMEWSQQGAIVSVVLHPPRDSMSVSIPAGVHDLIIFKGRRESMEVDVSDYNGNMMLVRKK